MSKKKEKVYASSLITSDILLGTPDGPVRLYIDENKRLSIDLEDNSGQIKSVRIDPTNNKIDVENVGFRDGSSLTLSNGKIPEDKIPEIIESKLSSDIRTKLNSTSTAISSYFDENNKLKDANAPSDYSSVRDNASNGNTARAYFDENGILNNDKLPDITITTVNFGTNFDTSFTSKNPVTIGVNGNFDTLFAGKNPITTANFGSNFDTAFTGKNAITTANFETQLGFSDRFDTAFSGKNPITTANFGTNFDTAFTGKNPVTDTNFSSKFNTEFGSNVPTGYNSWSDLATAASNGNDAFGKFSGANGTLPITSVVPPGSYANWNEIDTDLARGISASSSLDELDFSIDNSDINNPIIKINKGAGRFTTTTIGKSSIGLENVENKSSLAIRQEITITNGAITGIGTGDGIKVSNSEVSFGLNGQQITFNNGTESTITLDSGNVGLGNVANENPDTIRSGITIDSTGAIKGIGTGADTIIGNNKITVDGITGKLQGIGTDDIVVSNDKISITTDSTTGIITFNRGVGQSIDSNPFGSTKFTEVSGVANTAKSTADAASSTATTVRGFFTNTEVPQLNLTYLPILNESKLSSTITTKLGYANTLNGYFTGGKLQKVNAPEDYTEISQSAQSGSDAKNEIGTFDFSVDINTGTIFLSSSRGQLGNSITKTSLKLGNVANESPETIRSAISIDANGLIQGIGSGTGTAISNSKITVNSTTGVIEGIGTSNIPVDLRKAATTSFITSSNIVLVGNTARKVTNVSSWGDQIYSKDGFVSGAYCSAVLSSGTAMFGLNTDPTTDANYTSLDYAWYRSATSTTITIYESGVNRGSFASSLDDVLSITYDGKDIKYFINGELKRTVTIDITNKLFFDSSFYNNNSTLTNIQFGPLTSIKETYNLANTANTLSNTIENRFTLGKLNEANAADSLKNTNVFTDIKFTEVSGAADTAKTTAAAASSTATTVRGYFDTNGILDINNAPNEVKNSNISLNLANSSLSLTGGGGSSVAITKSTVGLSSVENLSPNDINNTLLVGNYGKNFLLYNEKYTLNLDVNLGTTPTTALWDADDEVVKAGSISPYSGQKFLVFTSNTERYLQFNQHISGSSFISFKSLHNLNSTLYDSNGLSLERPDSNDNLLLQYSIDSGSTWTNIETLVTGSSTNGSGVELKSHEIFINRTDSYLLRIAQSQSGGTGFDNYAIKDVSLWISKTRVDLTGAVSEVIGLRNNVLLTGDTNLTLSGQGSFKIIDTRTIAQQRTITIPFELLGGNNIGQEIEIIFSKNNSIKASSLILSITPSLSIIYPDQTGTAVSSYNITENKRFVISSGALYLV